jgi:hypothetical protein
MKKTAFDWDGCLEYKEAQKLAKELKKLGHDVQIVTTRWDEEHKQNYTHLTQKELKTVHNKLYRTAKKLGIPYHFTNFEYKAAYLVENNFDVLVDDNPDERKVLCSVENGDKVKFVYYGFSTTCDVLLDKIKSF